MNADSYGLKLNEQSSEQTVYDYNMLMSAMNVSVSKHLMDKNFTVVWANDYFYSQTLYTKQEYEAIYHNSCRKYFEQYPEEYEKLAMAIEQALLKRKSGYECICRMPRKDGSCSWIKVSGMFSDQKINDIPVIYSTFIDVTEAVEQKELQQQLEKRLCGKQQRLRPFRRGPAQDQERKRHSEKIDRQEIGQQEVPPCAADVVSGGGKHRAEQRDQNGSDLRADLQHNEAPSQPEIAFSGVHER
mgnify:CR=1 FL=1